MTPWAVLLAAGMGRRMGGSVKKQFLELRGIPVLQHTVSALAGWSRFGGLVVLAPADELGQVETICARAAGSLDFEVVAGGKTRSDSVRIGLSRLKDAAPEDPVFIHDGVRPFPPVESFDLLMKRCAPDGVIPALELRDTLKRVGDYGCEATLDRTRYRLAQTPQVFPYALIVKAHEEGLKSRVEVTDDAGLVELLGLRPAVVAGDPANVKLTTPEDLMRAKSFLDSATPSRVGHGYDAHQLVEGRRLILGGVEIQHTKGLLGHSDADVLAHAVSDACLGSGGLGDLGRHFPDSDPRYKGASSIELLKRVGELLAEKGLRVVSVDATLVAQRPKIAPYVEMMEANMSEALKLGPGGVTVKATTTEGMGFEGREEGISANAIAMVAPI